MRRFGILPGPLVAEDRARCWRIRWAPEYLWAPLLHVFEGLRVWIGPGFHAPGGTNKSDLLGSNRSR
jgi:hypothetical protein